MVTGKNKFNGVRFEMTDEEWKRVRHLPHVHGVLIPDPVPKPTPEILELRQLKQQEAAENSDTSPAEE